MREGQRGEFEEERPTPLFVLQLQNMYEDWKRRQSDLGFHAHFLRQTKADRLNRWVNVPNLGQSPEHQHAPR